MKRYFSFIFIIFAVCGSFVLCAANTDTKSQVPKKANRENKSKMSEKAAIEAKLIANEKKEAQEVSEKYKKAFEAFKNALKKNDFTILKSSAETMMELAAWKSVTRKVVPPRPWCDEYNTAKQITNSLQTLKLSCAKLTLEYFEKTIKAAPTPALAIIAKAERVNFMNRYLLMDYESAEKEFNALLAVPELQPKDKVSLLLNRGLSNANFKEFCAKREQARKVAGDDPSLRLMIYRVSLGRISQKPQKDMPDKLDVFHAFVNDPVLRPYLFSSEVRNLSCIFRSVSIYTTTHEQRRPYLEAELNKQHTDKELVEIYSLLAECYEKIWDRHYLTDMRYGSFMDPKDKQFAPELPIVEKAFACRKFVVDHVEPGKYNEYNLMQTYFALLYDNFMSGRHERLDSIVAGMEKFCPKNKGTWQNAVDAYRTATAFRNGDYFKAVETGKKVDPAKIKHYQLQWYFMEAYVRSLCALNCFDEAYALKDTYIQFAVDNWYYQQKNRYRRLFETIRPHCKNIASQKTENK